MGPLQARVSPSAPQPPAGSSGLGCCWGEQGRVTSGRSLTLLGPLGRVLGGGGGHSQVHANKRAGPPASIFLF